MKNRNFKSKDIKKRQNCNKPCLNDIVSFHCDRIADTYNHTIQSCGNRGHYKENIFTYRYFFPKNIQHSYQIVTHRKELLYLL